MRKFGAPLFCAAWANEETFGAKDDPLASYLVCGGGGGDGRTGVRNLLVVASYDSETRELSDPLYTHLTGEDAAFTMAMHPNGQDFVCSFAATVGQKGKLRHFRLRGGKKAELEDADHQGLTQFEEQRSLVFNSDGRLFAAGGEDGHLRVFNWPSLEVVLDRIDAHKSIKDLHFSLDSSFLAATDDSGLSRIWDLKSTSPAAALPLNRPGFCRFSRDVARPNLFVTSAEGGKGYITTWNMKWNKVGTKKIQDEPISAFAISSDGMLLATGSPSGDLSIVKSANMSILRRIRGAHMVFVTALDFCGDGRLLLSVSGDSSARVTSLETTQRGWGRALISWIVLIGVIMLSLVLSRGYWLDIPSIPDSAHDMI